MCWESWSWFFCWRLVAAVAGALLPGTSSDGVSTACPAPLSSAAGRGEGTNEEAQEWEVSPQLLPLRTCCPGKDRKTGKA